MAQAVEVLRVSDQNSFQSQGTLATRFKNAIEATIDNRDQVADRQSFWIWYNTFYVWTVDGPVLKDIFKKCFSFNLELANPFLIADYQWVYNQDDNLDPRQPDNIDQIARYFWAGDKTHNKGFKKDSRYYPGQTAPRKKDRLPIPDKLEHKYVNKQSKAVTWQTVNPTAKKGTPCWNFVAMYFDKKFKNGKHGLKYFIDIFRTALSKAKAGADAVDLFIQEQNAMQPESRSGGADEEHDVISPPDDNEGSVSNNDPNRPLINGNAHTAKQEFFNEYDVDGQNEYIPVMNHDYGYNQYYYPQQQQPPQLLLSPQVIPVQYGVNGLDNMNNNGVNQDYYVSNQWLFVLLPVLLIGACLFGIICMFLMGFGGLFCYREGKKSRVIDERDGFYRKLPQKDDIDMNKRDRGLVHYDESV